MSKLSIVELIDSKWKTLFGDRVPPVRRNDSEPEPPKMVWNFETPVVADKPVIH